MSTQNLSFAKKQITLSLVFLAVVNSAYVFTWLPELFATEKVEEKKAETPNRLKKYHAPTKPIDKNYEPEQLNEEEEKYARTLLKNGWRGNPTLLDTISFRYDERELYASASCPNNCICLGQCFDQLNEEQKQNVLQHELAHLRNKDTYGIGHPFIDITRWIAGCMTARWTYKLGTKSGLGKVPSLVLSLWAYITTKNMLAPLHYYEPWFFSPLYRYREYRADAAMVENCPDQSYIQESIKFFQSDLPAPNPHALEDNVYRPPLIKGLATLCSYFPTRTWAQELSQFSWNPYHPSCESRIKRLEAAIKKMESLFINPQPKE